MHHTKNGLLRTLTIIAQHPSLKYGSIWEVRPVGDMSEIMKASEQRRRKNTAR